MSPRSMGTLRTIYLFLFFSPSKVACNIGTVVGSTVLKAAGYYLGVCFEGIFEGGPSASPDLVFILQQVSLVYHLVLNFNLLDAAAGKPTHLQRRVFSMLHFQV